MKTFEFRIKLQSWDSSYTSAEIKYWTLQVKADDVRSAFDDLQEMVTYMGRTRWSVVDLKEVK